MAILLHLISSTTHRFIYPFFFFLVFSFGCFWDGEVWEQHIVLFVFTNFLHDIFNCILLINSLMIFISVVITVIIVKIIVKMIFQTGFFLIILNRVLSQYILWYRRPTGQAGQQQKASNSETGITGRRNVAVEKDSDLIAVIIVLHSTLLENSLYGT